MGFFRDLFGPRKPCDVCQLGQDSWPGDRSGVADWKLRGHGLSASFLICASCYQAINQAGLRASNPMLALVTLVKKGQARRPAVESYLGHPEWRKVWKHMLEQAGASSVADDLDLETIRELEGKVFDSMT